MERILGEMHSLYTSIETTADEETSKFWFLAILVSFSAVDNFVYVTTKTNRIVVYIFSSAADILISKQV